MGGTSHADGNPDSPVPANGRESSRRDVTVPADLYFGGSAPAIGQGNPHMQTLDSDLRQAAGIALGLVHVVLVISLLLWLATLLGAAWHWPEVAAHPRRIIAVVAALVWFSLGAASGLCLSVRTCREGACGLWRIATQDAVFMLQCACVVLGAVSLAVALP
jgi:hypothetical protein